MVETRKKQAHERVFSALWASEAPMPRLRLAVGINLDLFREAPALLQTENPQSANRVHEHIHRGEGEVVAEVWDEVSLKALRRPSLTVTA